MKPQRTIVYWGFAIDIVGPWFESKEQRRAIRKVLSRKRLRTIERAALLAVKAKLPSDFRVTIS